MQVPFIGRRQDIEQLHRTYPRGGGLFILGEPTGKTRAAKGIYQPAKPCPGGTLKQL